MHLALRLFFVAAALLLGTTVVLMVVMKQLDEGGAYMIAMLIIGLLSVGIPVVGGYGIVLGIVALVMRWRKRHAAGVEEGGEGEAESVDVEASSTSARPRR
jgi:hypothetical protein